MNRLTAYSLLLTAFFLSGCVTRVTPYEADRVDQEIKGNRGVVRGKAAPATKTDRKKTKTMYNIEVELSSRHDDEISERKDSDVTGNQGYMVRKGVSKDRQAVSAPKSKSTSTLKGFGAPRTPQVVYQAPATSEGKYKKEKGSGAIVEKEDRQPRVYVVEKGDTLQKISKKMYGTTKKWNRIYDANKGILKSPDMIKVGQELVIPE